MSESDEFLDTLSELKSFGFVDTGEQREDDEFFDVIEQTEEEEENDIPVKSTTDSIPSSVRSRNSTVSHNTPPLSTTTSVISPPLSTTKNERLSVLEFLQEDPENVTFDSDKNVSVPVRDMNKRETIYEFLNEVENDFDEEGEEVLGQNSTSEVSSLSALQKELREEEDDEKDDQFEAKEDELRRRVILNLPDRTVPHHPSHRESLLRRANPLASFFSDSAHPHQASSDSDSMISDLTETLTTRTDVSDLRLSRHASMLANDSGELRLAKRYKPVPVKTKSKQKTEFSSLFLIQELNRRHSTTTTTTLNRTSSVGSQNSNSSETPDPSKAIFVLKFSPDGHFLAAAGAEGIIKIWSLRQFDSEDPAVRVAAIFENEPVQVFRGHEAEILDCAWSANNFLLSASMDKTVRLWHHSRSDALGIFQHLDYVTSVAFHPRDPRIFLSGSLDCKLRIWSIQDRNIVHWNELPPGNFITAVAFTRSGSTVIAGTSGGTALIFDTEGLRYNTQILVRSSRSKTIGKKITSIESVPGNYENDERIMISSNDSRIRMYSLRDKNVIFKYKGHENVSSQIGASLSSEADFVLSGSENCRVYLWRLDGKFQKKSFFSSFRKDHIDSNESFKAHSNPVTAAIIAPSCVTNLLQSLQMRPISGLQATEGKIIVTADVTGQIKVFENNSKLIEWLK